MQTKITETTNIGGLGSPACRKLLKVENGPYTGRMMAIFKTSNSEIKFTTADNPYSNWEALSTIVSDSANTPIDAVMNSTGDVFLVYIETSTSHLVFVKLTITNEGWSIGAKIYIYNGNLTSTPSIVIDKTDILYTVFSRFNGTAFDLQVKSSSDEGQTWGSGPTDIGETLLTDFSLAIPKIMVSSDNLFVVYTVDYHDIKERHRALSGGSWTSEYTIGSGTSISTNFDAVVLPEGFLGVVYDDNQLIYREFNGVNWSSSTIIDSDPGLFPQLRVINNIPVMFYVSERDPGQNQLMQCSRISGTFSTPLPFEQKANIFDSVFMYDSVSASFSDKTSEAASNSAGDLFHSASNHLFKEAGDQLFVGSDNKFRYLTINLSTAGSGGSVLYSYFDGLNWISFTPSGGNYLFDTNNKELPFWMDFDNIPEQWQKTVVNGISRFWIKIEVTSAFITAPIGSQITSISNLKAVSVRR